MTATGLSSAPAVAPTPGTDRAVEPAVRARIAAQLRRSKDEVLEEWYRSQFAESFVHQFGIVGVPDRPTLEHGFLSPLFELLAAVVVSNDRSSREVYIDERLRYAPHQAGPDVRRAFFAEVLPRDEAALAEAVRAEDVDALMAIVGSIHHPLYRSPDGDKLRLLAVGDCLLGELRVFLPSRASDFGITLDVRCLYFSAVEGQSISTAQVIRFVEEAAPHAIAFSFLTYAGLPMYSGLIRDADRLSREELGLRVDSLTGVIRKFLADIREKTDATFLVHNASGLPLTRVRKHLPLPALSRRKRLVVERMNLALRELCENSPNTILLDEYAVAARHGHRRCAESVIPRSIRAGAFFHTSRFGEYLTEPYIEVLRAYRDLSKAKVLFVDFDNTLWKGVMADGPVSHYLDRQSLLRALRDAGMLLVALSKNDPANVRWNEMTLTPDDFVLHKINWDLKAQSIASAAHELDLGVDSFVLIDDNPVERELVHTELPGVRILDSTDPFTWRSLHHLLAFPNTRATEEARSRTEMYRAQAQRREAQSRAFDYPAMMAALRLHASFGRARKSDVDRVTELIQRTNQFNTTTIRRSKAEVQHLLESPAHAVYVAELADKFGTLGLVGVVVIERAARVATFDSFVMSCRAMGFGLERLMLRSAVDAESGADRFVGRFVATDRNTPAASLYADSVFTQQDATSWTLEADSPRPPLPEWIRLEARD
jgi:FkbH-like protein